MWRSVSGEKSGRNTTPTAGFMSSTTTRRARNSSRPGVVASQIPGSSAESTAYPASLVICHGWALVRWGAGVVQTGFGDELAQFILLGGGQLAVRGSWRAQVHTAGLGRGLRRHRIAFLAQEVEDVPQPLEDLQRRGRLARRGQLINGDAFPGSEVRCAP